MSLPGLSPGDQCDASQLSLLTAINKYVTSDEKVTTYIFYLHLHIKYMFAHATQDGRI